MGKYFSQARKEDNRKQVKNVAQKKKVYLQIKIQLRYTTAQHRSCRIRASQNNNFLKNQRQIIQLSLIDNHILHVFLLLTQLNSNWIYIIFKIRKFFTIFFGIFKSIFYFRFMFIPSLKMDFFRSIIFTIKVFYRNNSNRIRCMHLVSPKYEKQIDNLLKHQFHQICFNPAKRQALIRLTTTHSDASFEAYPRIDTEDGLKDVTLLNNYIRQVYEKYGIEDPIKKELRLAQRYTTTKNTPQKSLNVTNFRSGDRLTRTKKKLLNMKDSFKRDSEDVVYCSQILQNRPYQEGPSNISITRLNKEIGYRTKQKIRFKTDKIQDNLYSSPVLREFTLGNNQNEQQTDQLFKDKFKRSTTSRRKEFSDVIRYCPMCQDIVLQENIKVHESRCLEWLSAQQLSAENFQRLLVTKIKTLQGEIYHQIFQKNQQNIITDFTDAKKSIKMWMDKSEESSFQQIKTKFQSFSLNLFDKLAKLNWLRDYYNKMRIDCKIIKY